MCIVIDSVNSYPDPTIITSNISGIHISFHDVTVWQPDLCPGKVVLSSDNIFIAASGQ